MATPAATTAIVWFRPTAREIPRDGTPVLLATRYGVCEGYFEDGRWMRANLTLRDEDAIVDAPVFCALLPSNPAQS